MMCLGLKCKNSTNYLPSDGSVLRVSEALVHVESIRPLHQGMEWHIFFYYMEESVLLGTKPLVDSIRHFIRNPSGIFSVCHLCECRIVQ